VQGNVVKGQVLAEKYRLVRELGRGGMGSVWLADHIDLHSPVAIKLIDPALARSPEARSRFLREARAAGAMRSRHVVQVFDYGVDGETPFLVMEYLEGESLAARLERQKTLSLTEVQTVMRQVGHALTKAHGAGIVHRDLKPENIFIVSEGDDELVKVLDFGIAKVDAAMAVSVQTQTGMVLGTPFYMSPEQAEGRRELDFRSDLWSLGVIVYECLPGGRPFDGNTLAQITLAICPDPLPVPSTAGPVPAGFDEWFARATHRRVEGRYQSVSEMLEALLALEEPAAIPPTQPMPGPSPVFAPSPSAPRVGDTHTAAEPAVPASIPLHSSFGLWAWTGVGLLAVALGSAYWWLAPRQQREPEPLSLQGDVKSPTTAEPAAPSVLGPSVAQRPAIVSPDPAPELPALPRPPRETAVTPAPQPFPRMHPTPLPTTAPVPTAAPAKPTLHCEEHALSGRLVRVSARTRVSFPCYVHAISGQLRRK